MKGVAFKPADTMTIFLRNVLIYGIGGVIVPFIGIKLIDVLISGTIGERNWENRTPTEKSRHVRPIIGMAVVSLLVCGLLFPLLITGVAQLVFPYQANGELAYVNGHPVGSVVAVNSTDYSLPVFFHLRNNTASGFDPDITLQDAQSQIPEDKRRDRHLGIDAAREW